MTQNDGQSITAVTGNQPGIVMIQIDGFSFHQCQSAIEKGEMPFLRSLIRQGQYRLSLHYSGVPASTACVQGELFYGIRQSLPAFRFWDRSSRKEFRMSEGDAAVAIEEGLAQQGEGLLKDGSSYSNNYGGGAREFHFCATSLSRDRIWKEINLFELGLFLAGHPLSFLKITFLTVWEILAGLFDGLRWALNEGGFLREVQFVFIRALVCVCLREMITLAACRDIRRGLAVIHLNFLGYDEQAHHRGPSSGFAHRSLGSIDAAIRKIYQSAIRAKGRNYDVWVYSDHGQDIAIPYSVKYGRTLEEGVRDVLRDFNIETHGIKRNDRYSRRQDRLGYITRRFIRAHKSAVDGQQAVITADGTLGNIYLPQPLSQAETGLLAQKLVANAKIPAVAVAQGADQARVWTREGELTLPQQAEAFFGQEHPFLKEVTGDLIGLCHHPLGGDVLIMGWQKNGQKLTFSFDRGDHAGPSVEETSAFALMPGHVFPAEKSQPFLKTMDLRQAALSALNRTPGQAVGNAVAVDRRSRHAFRTLRLMTYNVHSCLGMDGKVSPERIARVISRHEPDIVALQELDLWRPKTGGQDQPHIIARYLEMFYHFHPAMQVEEQQYGNAVFSRFPMQLKKTGALPALFKNPFLEPRGAMWVDIDVEGRHLQLFNTHLSLLQNEGQRQAGALLGNEWTAHPECRGPMILCGDFNALPSSALCRNVKKVLFDAQENIDQHRPRATWFSHYPLGRIDHIFVNADIEVTAARVLGSDLNKIASDHLPLIIDLRFRD